MLCLALGLLSLVLFLGSDYATAAIGRLLLKGRLEAFLHGDCSLEETPSVGLARSLRSPAPSRSPSAVPKELKGLRLSVSVSPFSLERSGNLVTFREMGPWVLQTEVQDDVWIMQDPQRSRIAVDQPINNVNLLALLVLMVMDNMAPGIFQNTSQMFPVTFYNMSILERVSDVRSKMEIIMNLYNSSMESNTLDQIQSFLSRGSGSALVYNGYSLHVAGRNISSKPRAVRSLPPLSLVPIQYYLPALGDLTWEYWRSGVSPVTGAPVNQYKVKDIWEPSLLCRAKDQILYNIQKTFREYGVFLAPPESARSKIFAVKWSGDEPFSALLDVYRPFGIPVGGSLMGQVNILIPMNTSTTNLRGEITPVARVTVRVDDLPEDLRVWLVRLMYIRTGILLFLVWLSFFFLSVGTMKLLKLRRERNKAFNRTNPYHDPL